MSFGRSDRWFLVATTVGEFASVTFDLSRAVRQPSILASRIEIHYYYGVR